MKVYICGNIKDAPAFEMAELLLRQQGHIPISPRKVLFTLPEEITNSDFTVIAFELIRVCEAVYLLNDWETDFGARVELAHAKRLGKEILNEAGKYDLFLSD